jgi:xanthine/CO dehydrogenase XdhC/CoxF family maturation factor
MKEIRKILQLYSQIDFARQKVALATVVRVEGSSYRRPGAKMLITDDGRWEGAISGGCLEGDALRKARQVMLDGKPMVVTYDTMNDDANSLGVGLGCNGIIDVFIEPIEPEPAQDAPSRNHTIDFWQRYVSRREAFVMAKVIRASESYAGAQRWNFSETDDPHVWQHRTDRPVIERQLLADAEAMRQSPAPVLKRYETDTAWAEVYIESVQPEIELVIFGGGYDVPPLVQMAKVLGWHVTVTEDCIAHVAPKRFPGADAVRLIDRNSITQEIKTSPRMAAVLMSHGYKYDKAVLEQLLASDIGYIGMLGPRKRFEKMMGEWENEEKSIDEDRLVQVHSPIGLDIGAETPDEIALAVLAEIQAHFSGKSAAPLRLKQGPIHERMHS